MKGDELRARRLAKLIASIGVMDERIKRILEYGDARYQEGVERGLTGRDKEESPKQPDQGI